MPDHQRLAFNIRLLAGLDRALLGAPQDATMNTQKTIERIAHEYLGISTLKTQMSDSLDFHDVSVGGIAAALEAAFEAGKQAAGQAIQGGAA